MVLDGRKEEDIFPTFYRLNSIPEIKNLAEESEFEVRKDSHDSQFGCDRSVRPVFGA